MKLAFWSAYGFNPYMGGTHSLASRIVTAVERKGWKIFSYDIVGMDRTHPLMRDVYKMRTHSVKQTDRLKWVIDNICKTYIMLPDGSVYLKDIGNNSGNVGTTQDNIIGHDIVLAYTFVTIYGPNFELIRTLMNNIFGDDNIGCAPIHDEKLWEEKFRQGFRDFGWELDPLIINQDITTHTFLGFTFVKYENRWVPQYNSKKIATSFCYTINRFNNDEALFGKAYSLLIMSATHEQLFELIAEALYTYLDESDSECPVVKAMKSAGLPKREACLGWMAGIETGGGRNKILTSYATPFECKHYNDNYYDQAQEGWRVA